MERSPGSLQETGGGLPLVSVITPCLNPGSRLKRCVQSVVEQTYPHIEHVVVDGGSTDGTIEFLRSQTHLRWISEPDSGQTAAINKGFRMAEGSLLGWLNSDDVLLPDAVHRVVSAFRGSTERVGWVYGDCRVSKGSRHWRRRSTPKIDAHSFDLDNPICQPGTFIARWAIEKVEYLDEALHLVMDRDLWIRLAIAGVPSVYLTEELSIFEIHDNSKTATAGRGEFAYESALALLKVGHIRAAAVNLGRTAAWRAMSDGVIDRSRLDSELSELSKLLNQHESPNLTLVMRAEALVEAVAIESPSVKRFRHLVSVYPWKVPESRRRLAKALVRRLNLLHPWDG